MLKKLYSHGPESDLIEHTLQVADRSRNDSEKIARLCHDVIKATVPWQDYIVRSTTSKGVRIESPHHHAMAGGLLACAVLRILKHDLKWQIAALHSCAAHHGFLQSLNPGREYENHLEPAFRSEQANDIFQIHAEAVWACAGPGNRRSVEKLYRAETRSMFAAILGTASTRDSRSFHKRIFGGRFDDPRMAGRNGSIGSALRRYPNKGNSF